MNRFCLFLNALLIYHTLLISLFLYLCSLFNLYNLVDHPYARFQVYMKALTLAVDGKVTEYIVSSFKKIDNFLKEWNIDIKDQRELFLAIANVLKENKRYETEFILYNYAHQSFSVSFFFCFRLGITIASCFFSVNTPAWWMNPLSSWRSI